MRPAREGTPRRWALGASQRAFAQWLAIASARHYALHLLRGSALFWRAQSCVAALLSLRLHAAKRRLEAVRDDAQAAGATQRERRALARAMAAWRSRCVAVRGEALEQMVSALQQWQRTPVRARDAVVCMLTTGGHLGPALLFVWGVVTGVLGVAVTIDKQLVGTASLAHNP